MTKQIEYNHRFYVEYTGDILTVIGEADPKTPAFKSNKYILTSRLIST